MTSNARRVVAVGLLCHAMGCGVGAPPDVGDSADGGEPESGPVSEVEAITVAHSWPMAPECDDLDRSISSIKREVVDDVVTSYLIRYAGGGFIVVSGIHEVVPVIGYSCSPGSIDQSQNPTTDAFLREVNQGIRGIAAEQHYSPHPMWSRLASTAAYRAAGDLVAPLITTRWNQGGLYNEYTPRIDGSPTLLGCGALALGQLLNYYEFPAHGSGTNTYTWNGQLMRGEFVNQQYDWELMVDELTPETGEAETEAVTQFLNNVALAAEMNYGTSYSGSFITQILEALVEYFRYPDAGSREAKSWYSDADWTALMKSELRESRPVFYEGTGTAGHFFLLDGYDESDYFHVNWGWGGAYDGYFHINSLRPGSNDFSNANVAQIGIEPERRAEGEPCGGYAGTVCASGLECKHRVDTAGTCRPSSWCHADTASADCNDLEPPDGNGSWGCTNNTCDWTTGGGTQTETDAGSVASSQWVDYGPYDVVADGSLTAVLSPTSGDADLYVKVGGLPGTNDYDCRPYLGGTQVETCALTGPGQIYVAVKGYATSSTYDIEVTRTTGGGTAPAPVCGNGVLEGAESCDGSQLSCSAIDPTFIGGTASCDSTCSALDTSSCTVAVCGDGATQGAEVCDGEYLTCTEYDSQYTQGDAFCTDDCRAWNIGACYSNICGNGAVEKPEDCDGANDACTSVDPQRFDGGTAVCQADCSWDLSGCQSAGCGNGVIDPGEQCDTNAPVQCSAVDGQYTGGIAICSDCQWNTSSCEYCGNGQVEGDELCDGNTIACTELDASYTGGEATCSHGCDEWILDQCQSSGPQQVTVTVSGTATAGQWHHYGPFDAGSGELSAVLNMTADVDLYVRRGAQPTASSWDCRPYKGGATTESCALSGPGVFYVSVNGYASSASFDLSVTYWTGGGAPAVEEFSDAGAIGAGQWNHYGPFESGTGELEAILGGTGDVDLYVRAGSQPTASSYDCRPYLSSSNETCTLPGPGSFYVSINGWASSSTFDLQVRYPPAQ